MPGEEALVKLKERVSPDRAAVVIIDMQNDFVSAEGKMAKFGFATEAVRATVPLIRKLLDAARVRSFPVIHTCMINDDAQNPLSWRSFWGEPVMTLPGSWGAEPVEELRPLAGEIVLEKYTYGAFIGTNLDTILRRMRIQTLIIAGTDPNICAGDTMHQAFALGYHIVAVSDCLASFSKIGAKHAEQLREMGLYLVENHFGLVAPSVQLIEIMKQAV
ncbi:MAG: isochorismatase family cysteine hydrolase [Spirochaetia bacterium]|jgi:ureidoacrylate peracid hydrolase